MDTTNTTTPSRPSTLELAVVQGIFKDALREVAALTLAQKAQANWDAFDAAIAELNK